MKFVKEFLTLICELDLSNNLHKVSNDMYNELEFIVVDWDLKELKKNKNVPKDVKRKFFEFFDFYYLTADDCIISYTDKEKYEFLKELKTRAEELSSYLVDQ